MQEKFSEVTLILFGSTVIILLLTGLIVFSLFINQKRKYRFRQEKSELKNNFDRELLRSHLEIQNQAFESISRELHDNVGTLISIAMVHIKSLPGATGEAGAVIGGAVANGIKNNDQGKLSEVDSLLNEAMDTLRDISRSLNPENITRLGWQNSFLTELERVRKTNLFAVHYSEEGTPFIIELQKQVIIFRILQETLNNIVKHSYGNNIYSHVGFSGNEVTITIRDDGKGFQQGNDASGVRQDLPGQAAGLSSKGSGINNMLARAAMLPAVLHIINGVGSGTIVSLSYKEQGI
ncbi:sensor histidine kinase [Flavitalea flava]